MTKIDKLLKELCPYGVEYVELKTVCNIYDGTHQTPNYTDDGIKFVSVENINDLYSTKKFISEKDFESYKIKPKIDDVLMTRIGSIGVCTVVDRKEPLAYYVSLALLRPNTMILNSKFLKYAIESLHGRKELRKRTLVNAVPIKVNKDDIGKITIPLPPLPVQAEIVRILDSFTELTAELTTELTAELTARKRQYEYYRNKLLNFHDTVNYKTLGEICYLSAGGDVPKNNFSKTYNDNFQIPIYSNGIGDNALYGYTNIAKINERCVTIAARGTIGYCALRKAPFFPIIRLICAIPKNEIIADYLKYVIETIKFQVPTSGIPQLTVPMVAKYKIPVLPLKEQERIVSILDRFNKLCNDISEGLQAEIFTRQKQYEYYRDKLLTFSDIGAR